MDHLTHYKKNALKNILWVGFLVGSLDGLAALLLNYNVGPTPIFKFIASGVFGADAFKGGTEMVVAGIVPLPYCLFICHCVLSALPL